MLVLVTGASGRVGQRLLPRLLRNTTVTGLRALVRRPDAVADIAGAGVEAVVGDVRDADVRRKALEGVDAVVHLAAALRRADPSEMPTVNTDATVALAEDSMHHGVIRFVFVSTNLVYGEAGDGPFTEHSPLRPSENFGVYPASKAAAERALLELHTERGLPVVILRLAFVYGDGDPHLREALMWASEWARHHRLHMVHHADVAQAVRLALHGGGIDGGVYNVGDDAPVTAAELFELNGVELPPEPTRELSHPWEGVMSTRRIREELGFRSIYPTAWSAWAAGAL
jgi:nucleoside-diphosphate-sugar epimerase